MSDVGEEVRRCGSCLELKLIGPAAPSGPIHV